MIDFVSGARLDNSMMRTDKRINKPRRGTTQIFGCRAMCRNQVYRKIISHTRVLHTTGAEHLVILFKKERTLNRRYLQIHARRSLWWLEDVGMLLKSLHAFIHIFQCDNVLGLGAKLANDRRLLTLKQKLLCGATPVL